MNNSGGLPMGQMPNMQQLQQMQQMQQMQQIPQMSAMGSMVVPQQDHQDSIAKDANALDPQANLRQSSAMQQVRLQSQQRPKFNFEPFLLKEYNLGLFPDRSTCEYWLSSTSNTPYGSHHAKHAEEGQCPLGNECPLKHPSKIFKNKIVCKYWLRGLCKMGNQCDFLHEYNLSKMPECVHYSQTGQCQQAPECIYLHVDAKTKIAECPDYSELGFCPDGPNCQKRHVRRVLCDCYITGFCPKGPTCDMAHPKFSVVRSQNGRFIIQSDEDIINKRLQLIKEQSSAGATVLSTGESINASS